MHLIEVHSSTESVIYNYDPDLWYPYIQTSTNGLRIQTWRHLYVMNVWLKKFIDHRKHASLQNIVVPISSTMTNDSRY